MENYLEEETTKGVAVCRTPQNTILPNIDSFSVLNRRYGMAVLPMHASLFIFQTTSIRCQN